MNHAFFDPSDFLEITAIIYVQVQWDQSNAVDLSGRTVILQSQTVKYARAEVFLPQTLSTLAHTPIQLSPFRVRFAHQIW